MNPDAIEQRVWDAVEDGPPFGEERVELIEQIDEVIAWRTRNQGESHPDIIWPLALRIELLLGGHKPELAAEAAEVGERRLEIQRVVLRDVRDELITAILAQAGLYTFEDAPFDVRRQKELEREAAGMEAAHGR